MKNNKERIEEEVEKIIRSNKNKINIILDRNKNSCFLQEYLEDLIRYGFNQGSQSKEKEIEALQIRIGNFHKFLSENNLTNKWEEWEFKDMPEKPISKQKLKGDKKV